MKYTRMDKKQFDPAESLKGTAPNNYRTITCLPKSWTIVTVQQETYLPLTNKPWIVPWGTKNILQRIQRYRRVSQHRSTQQKQNQAEKFSYDLDWLEKVHDTVPQSCLKMYKISNEVINVIEKTMKTWKVELTTGRRRLAGAKIQRGIFQGDAL